MAVGISPDNIGGLLPGALSTDLLIVEGLVQHRAAYGADETGHGVILEACDDAFLRPHYTASEVGHAMLLDSPQLAERRLNPRCTALELTQQLALSGAAFRFSVSPSVVIPPTRHPDGGEAAITPTIHKSLLERAKASLSTADWSELASRRAAYNRAPNDPAVYRKMQAGLFATIIEVAYKEGLDFPIFSRRRR